MTARLVIAGTHSGVGKTTISVGVMAGLARQGLRVQGFKVGPDYIDPTYHSLATGRPCRNLDTWMVPPQRVYSLFAHAVHGADIAIIEGVMGLYDGFGYEGETGSTAEVAKLLGAPVILVLDAGKIARSAGALALGYQRFDPDLPLAGFVINRVGSESHGQGVAIAVEQATGMPVLGWLPRDPSLDIPERHLGLVPTAEPGRWCAFMDAAANHVAQRVDLERLRAIAQEASALATPEPPSLLHNIHPVHPTQRGSGQGRVVIAVAQDEAFSFTYEDNLALLQAAGAEIVPFSPLHDPALPPGTRGVILSGGFPELYASQLSTNVAIHQALCNAHERGIPIYAECGGLMFLTEAIVDLLGKTHRMVGLLPGHSVIVGNLTLGYRLAQAADDSWLLSAGEEVRGHEFHYSTWEGRPPELPPAFYLQSPRRAGDLHPEGAHLGSLWASYTHIHFWSKPELATRFVEACRSLRQSEK